MYLHCVFCARPFDRNGALEWLDVGRRIAFDPAKGRLWVVCRRCERWNLVPLESRWEAVEEAERLFRATRVRASTEQIGLARVADGIELVRIGKPLRPEFAAWRYGDQFGRRRRRAFLVGTGLTAAAATAMTAGLVTGIVSASLLAQGLNFSNYWYVHRTAIRIPSPAGGVLKVKSSQLQEAMLGRYYDGTWFVKIPPRKGFEETVFTGADAERVAATLLSRLNSSGGTRRLVSQAVTAIEQRGGPEPFMTHLMEEPPLNGWQRTSYAPARGFRLAAFPRPQRLALEMALHEERERQFMEGELERLASAWLAAEEIAAIADDLVVAATVRTKLANSRQHDGTMSESPH